MMVLCDVKHNGITWKEVLAEEFTDVANELECNCLTTPK